MKVTYRRGIIHSFSKHPLNLRAGPEGGTGTQVNAHNPAPGAPGAQRSSYGAAHVEEAEIITQKTREEVRFKTWLSLRNTALGKNGLLSTHQQSHCDCPLVT